MMKYINVLKIQTSCVILIKIYDLIKNVKKKNMATNVTKSSKISVFWVKFLQNYKGYGTEVIMYMF